MEIEIVEDGLTIQFAGDGGMGGDTAGAGAKDQLTGLVPITQGADTHPVDCHKGMVSPGIQDGQGKGTVNLL